jgi:cytochrome c-type biogenesis protein CcmH
MKTLLVALGLLLLSAAIPVMGIDVDAPLSDPGQRALYERLTEEVRCLVCQNQSLADSTAPLAEDLRREIKGQVESGRSEAEIKSFLTQRYGDFVLYRPRFAGASMILWLAPFLLVAVGGIALWRILRRRMSLPVTTDSEDERDGKSVWE